MNNTIGEGRGGRSCEAVTRNAPYLAVSAATGAISQMRTRPMSSNSSLLEEEVGAGIAGNTVPRSALSSLVAPEEISGNFPD